MLYWRSVARVFATVVVASMSTLSVAQTWPPQLQLSMQVPFDPTVFPSAGRNYLVYELYLSNFESRPVTINRVEVLDADNARPVATFEAQQLNTILHHMGEQIVGDKITAGDDESQRQLAPGEALVAYLYVTLGDPAPVPRHLRHRVLTDTAAVEGATIATHHNELRVLGSPLEGVHWLAGSGPGNDSHHRRQILVLDGAPHVASRYAIDWMQVENGTSFAGDERSNSAYHSYGKPVLAVANGKVILVKDGIPENIPGHFGEGSLAVVMSSETLAGNTIALDLGGNQFAHYDHLQPGSLRVKVGQRVRRGQVLALIGNTGSSFEPHLHFELTTDARTLYGEGLPYTLDQYHGLPLQDVRVDFPTNH